MRRTTKAADDPNIAVIRAGINEIKAVLSHLHSTTHIRTGCASWETLVRERDRLLARLKRLGGGAA